MSIGVALLWFIVVYIISGFTFIILVKLYDLLSAKKSTRLSLDQWRQERKKL